MTFRYGNGRLNLPVVIMTILQVVITGTVAYVMLRIDSNSAMIAKINENHAVLVEQLGSVSRFAEKHDDWMVERTREQGQLHHRSIEEMNCASCKRR